MFYIIYMAFHLILIICFTYIYCHNYYIVLYCIGLYCIVCVKPAKGYFFRNKLLHSYSYLENNVVYESFHYHATYVTTFLV